MIRAPAVLALAAAGAACGGEIPEPQDGTVVEVVEPRRELPPFPQPPPPRPGRLAFRTAGDADTLEGVWAARAARCEDPPALQVLADADSAGMIALLHLPQGGDPPGLYPVVIADSAYPDPPSVRVGVQVTRTRSVAGYQAVDGEVMLEEMDGEVSGRLTVTLRDVDSFDSLRYVGVFAALPVTSLPPERCREIREALTPPDSGRAEDGDGGS